jgi:hypothetical protein
MHKSSFFKPSNANNNNPSSNAWQIVGKRQNQNHNLAEKTPQSYDERFPTLLADHLKEPHLKAEKKNNVASDFASDFASVLTKPLPKAQVVESELKPGWVYLSKAAKEGRINYVYGEQPLEYLLAQQAAKENAEEWHSEQLFQYRVRREQYFMDCENERLGDLSPYWSEPPAMHKYNAYINQENRL